MAKYINNEFSSSDWLRYFSNKSNHWILKYWRNNKDIFFKTHTCKTCNHAK